MLKIERSEVTDGSDLSVGKTSYLLLSCEVLGRKSYTGDKSI